MSHSTNTYAAIGEMLATTNPNLFQHLINVHTANQVQPELSDGECWEYIFRAFGGEHKTPPAVDRHPELVAAVRQAYNDGRAVNSK